ncbi:MAG: Glu/Leu/Phe/Val dehydrogenase [Candidatus Aminicenantes bacterium]|nr:MAG: Glu/Leu/Phe/Val dehydrogenase [Candidatus Aminicenantes bacterium]
MEIFEHLGKYNYQQVVFCNDNSTGLKAIIAIHDTTLGPALGGVRMWPFPSEEAALEDVLRLARGMTYKASISGVNLGGGKSVVIGDPNTQKTEALLRAMGRFINSLGGKYIAGQDIGTDSHDMAVIVHETPFVSCVHQKAGGPGDPSFATAFGVKAGMQALLKESLGSDSLSDRRIAIQGVGNVGYFVAKYCHEEGAKIIASDVSEEALKRAKDEFDAEIVDPDNIYEVDCDIFSPCAFGAVVNDETISMFKCKGIAGSANNVLAEDRHGIALQERGILYGPDYLVNSGGLIRCEEEVLGEVLKDRVLEKVSRIYDQTLQVIQKAKEGGISTAKAADRLAEERIEKICAINRIWAE